MTGARPRETAAATSRSAALVALPLFALGYTLAAAAWIALAGVSTSAFSLTLTRNQMVPLVGLFFAAYLVAGAIAVAPRLLIRHPRMSRSHHGAYFGGMTAVTVWVVLVVSYLPLKGSETFVTAGRLTTLQLNLIALVGVLAAGVGAGWLAAVAGRRLLSAARSRLGGGRLAATGLVAALVAVTLLGVGWQRAGGAPGVSRSRPRVAIVGVDGCDWEKLQPLLDAGELPTFRRLIENGASGTLLSIEPLISPKIWTSIATGKVADKHGIRNFVNERNVPVNATMRRATPVWDIVSSRGGVVGVTGWYVTWPANEVRGFLVSDRLHSLLRGPVQMLETAQGRPTNERLESFGDFDFDAGYKRYEPGEKRYQQNRIVDEPLRWGYLRDTIYGAVADALLPRYRPDLSAVYYRGVDFVQHFFWKYSDPDPYQDVTPVDIEAYGEVIDNYYRYQDDLLAKLLDALGEDVNVIVVSDHGFTRRLDIDPSLPQLTGMHDVRGVVIASGPAFRRGATIENATILDIAPTALAVMGHPVAADMDGRPLTDIITEEHLEACPIMSVPTYETAGARAPDEVGSTMDESIKEKLRALGYIQ